jgi:hypothetical protein
LKKFTLQNPDKYITIFSKKINSKIFKIFNDVISKNYDYIIDAGNILYSQKGQIGSHSIEDLKTVIDTYPNSLIIICKKHVVHQNRDGFCKQINSGFGGLVFFHKIGF